MRRGHGGREEDQDGENGRRLERRHAADAVAGGAAVGKARAESREEASRRELPDGNAGPEWRAQRGEPERGARDDPERVDEAPCAAREKARLAELRLLREERPDGREHRAHAADETGGEEEQAHPQAEKESAGEVVLPAVREELSQRSSPCTSPRPPTRGAPPDRARGRDRGSRRRSRRNARRCPSSRRARRTPRGRARR